MQVTKLLSAAAGQVSNQKKWTHAYRITPTNFDILSADKKMRMLQRWWNLLSYLQSEICITITVEYVQVPAAVADNPKIQKQQVNGMLPTRVILVKSREPLERIFENVGNIKVQTEIPTAWPHQMGKIVRENIKDIVIQHPNSDSHHYYCRAFSLVSTPMSLQPAWINRLVAEFGRVEIYIKPLETNESLSMISKRMMLFSDIKNPTDREQQRLESMKNMKSRIANQSEHLFEFSVAGYLFGKDRAELKKHTTDLKRSLRAMSVNMTTSLGHQKKLMQGGGVKFFSNLQSMSILYPLSSSDMMEIDSGIYLGTNVDTDSPIFYDVNMRINHNIFTFGTTGAGKSFTNKILLKRFSERRPNTMCLVIDPQDEYIEHAQYFGLEVLQMIPGRQYGLDPFLIMDSQLEAVDLLGKVTNASKDATSEWKSLANGCYSITDLYKKTSEQHKKYLAELVEGPIAEMFRGTPKISERMIVSLKALDGHTYEAMIVLLILEFAWKMVNARPDSLWKYIMVDEAWIINNLGAALKLLGEIARKGRKRSLILALSTQNVDDLDKAIEGATRITELFDTKIVMNLVPEAALRAQGILHLNDDETERIMAFRSGQGMILTQNNQIYAEFAASRDETETYFNTKAEKL